MRPHKMEVVTAPKPRGPCVSDVRNLIDAALDRWYTADLPIVLARYSGGLDIGCGRQLRTEPMIDYAGVAYGVPVALRCLTLSTEYFYFEDLAPLAAESLARFTHAGGSGFVVAFFRPLRTILRLEIGPLIDYRYHSRGAAIDTVDVPKLGRAVPSNLVNDLDLFREERITVKDHAIPSRSLRACKGIWA